MVNAYARRSPPSDCVLRLVSLALMEALERRAEALEHQAEALEHQAEALEHQAEALEHRAEEVDV